MGSWSPCMAVCRHCSGSQPSQELWEQLGQLYESEHDSEGGYSLLPQRLRTEEAWLRLGPPGRPTPAGGMRQDTGTWGCEF